MINSLLKEKKALMKAIFIQESALRQGEHVRTQLTRDIIVGYGNWEFDPTELSNPFSIVTKGRFIYGVDSKNTNKFHDMFYSIYRQILSLPWVKFHEVPDGGHYIIHKRRHLEAIIKATFTE